jgi:hypothetical protein
VLWSTYPVQDEIRAVFVRFVAAQNAHDGDTVGSMIWDSPEFLWVSRGNTILHNVVIVAQFLKRHGRSGITRELSLPERITPS